MNASMADVDSIDASPRIAPPTASGVSPVEMERREQSDQQQTPKCDLEDIFQPTVAADTHSEVLESGPPRGDGHSSTPSSSSSGVRIPLMPVTASRARVPSKEILYGRSGGSHQHRLSPSLMTAADVAIRESGDDVPVGQEGVGRHRKLTALPPSPAQPLSQQYGDSVSATRAAAVGVAATSVRPKPHRQKSRVAKFIVDVEGDPSISTDALVRRMETKEKEFDKKIHQIHHTFQNAGEQLVVRDNIIAHLKEELESLRAEADRIPKEYQAREEKLLRRVEAMMAELSEEQKRAQHSRRAAEEEVRAVRDSLQTAERQLAQQQHMSEDLLRQLHASDKALQDEKQRHSTALAESRCAYEAKLNELQRTFRSMEKQVAKSQSRLEDMEKDRCQQQAKLLELELSGRRRISSETLKTKELLTENEALRDEVEAVRLSMAHLLRLMSEVPCLSDYLRWNELSSEFVFLGYPTRYFRTSYRGQGAPPSSPSHLTGSRGASPRQRQRSPARRRAAAASAGDDLSFDKPGPSSHSSGYYQDANISAISAGDTGVEDGVYAGVSASLSKNVWLNGRWAQEMISIIAAENNFTRLKRIKLLELEEAAQLTEQLPSARDVLECRQPEHHYWIPYAVFMEAQKFKNKYYPKLPAMSHFSPFLIQLNKIWRAKLQDRLRVTQQQQQLAQARRSATDEGRFRSRTRAQGSDMGDEGSSALSRLTSRCAVSPSPMPRELFSEWARQEARIDEIHAEHHRLRREVRLHVSSQKSLQLFRLYDELVRGAHQTLGEVLRLAEDLYDSAAAQRLPEPEDQKRTATNAFRERKRASQASAEMSELAAARDRLLCILDHTCEQVCDVGDSLSTRMMSNYSDLHRLIYMLQRRLRLERERSGYKTREAASSNAAESDSSASSSTSPWSEVGSSAAFSTTEQQERLRKLLRDQYGAACGPGADAHYTADAATAPEAVSSDALWKLAASVLDFSEEVRREVTQATAALRVVTEQAMREAMQPEGT
ncbi:hypothetical protein LSCM1_02123 [Leishmania martiniquensis]|uniref:Uncharacterized protein n=1 Tax=Leishmania martiniquensis TaxID=1580590 RepID=A0A836G7X1_9TRYP|nr:hypothetical protein LSCM1_02123 [Leishmania martiniquensis]